MAHRCTCRNASARRGGVRGGILRTVRSACGGRFRHPTGGQTGTLRFRMAARPLGASHASASSLSASRGASRSRARRRICALPESTCSCPHVPPLLCAACCRHSYATGGVLSVRRTARCAVLVRSIRFFDPRPGEATAGTLSRGSPVVGWGRDRGKWTPLRHRRTARAQMERARPAGDDLYGRTGESTVRRGKAPSTSGARVRRAGGREVTGPWTRGGSRGPEYRCTAVRRRMKFVLAVPSAPDTRVPRPCLHFPHFVILLVYARRGGANGRVEVRPMSVCSFFAASARVQRGKLRLGRARVPLGLSSSGVETDGIGLTRRKGQGRSIHLFVATRAGSARLPYESGAPTEYCDNAEFTQHCHGVPAFGAGAPARPVPAGRGCGIKQLVPPPLCADWRRPLLRATA